MPVAYVLVPPGASAKTLAAEFARYLGIPVTTRMTQAQITEAVCHTYNQAGVHPDLPLPCRARPANHSDARAFHPVGRFCRARQRHCVNAEVLLASRKARTA
ncbi:hypothetical protein ACIA74_39025 [Streptomyces sp. NPDC051658]|uniref:hypothetical protein n=1 Tax=unclassified Streptomyces TaxID=2593676 RepID=UPI0037AA757B